MAIETGNLVLLAIKVYVDMWQMRALKRVEERNRNNADFIVKQINNTDIIHLLHIK